MEYINDIWGNAGDIRLDQCEVRHKNKILMPYFPTDCKECGEYLGDRELTKHENAFNKGKTHFDVKCKKCKKIIYSIDVVSRAYFDVSGV